MIIITTVMFKQMTFNIVMCCVLTISKMNFKNSYGIKSIRTRNQGRNLCLLVNIHIDPSWGGLIELFLVPASAPRLV